MHLLTCATCSVKFESRQRTARYCTRRCKYRAQHIAQVESGWRAAWQASNRDKDRERIREYRARKPFRQRYPETYADGDARRAQRKLDDAEQVSPVEIFDRDGWTCGICDQSIARDRAWPDPLSASLDHVVPLAKGGKHTRDNLQAAHLRCNLQKGDRVA